MEGEGVSRDTPFKLDALMARLDVKIKTNRILHDFSNPSATVPRGGNIGTPLAWLDEILFSDDISSSSAKKYVISIPNNRNPDGAVFPSWKTTWYIGKIVRETDTWYCYETYGGISKKDGRLKYTSPDQFRQARRWEPTPEYDEFLNKLATLSGTPKDDIVAMDMSMRVKRARFNDPSTSVTTEDGRSFVFVSYFEETSKPGDHPLYQFLEITRTRDPLQQSCFDPPPKYEGPQCHFCQAHGPGVTLLFCGKCRKVRYCGKDHQRADWPMHRHVCQ